jgi:hypothetical protein
VNSSARESCRTPQSGGLDFCSQICEHIGKRTAAVLAHGLIKERLVPPKDIDLAVEQKSSFDRDPACHTYREG